MGYNPQIAVLHNIEADAPEKVAAEMDKVVGDLSHFEVTGQQLLVGVFVRPTTKTVRGPTGQVFTLNTGGTGKEAVEDQYQGKVVRVLKIGPQAFPEEFYGEWGGCVEDLPDVGDWLVCESAAGLQLSVQCPGSEPTDMFDTVQKISSKGGWPCRLIYAADIRGRISSPAIVV